MGYALQIFRARLAPDAFLRLVDAVLRARFVVRTRRHNNGQERAASLNAATVRDIGAARQYQDYAASADFSACADRHLYRIADDVRWASSR